MFYKSQLYFRAALNTGVWCVCVRLCPRWVRAERVCVVAARLLDFVCEAEQKTQKKRNIYREMIQEPHQCPVTTVTHAYPVTIVTSTHAGTIHTYPVTTVMHSHTYYHSNTHTYRYHSITHTYYGNTTHTSLLP